MRARITNEKTTGYDGRQLWRNPADNRIYATVGEPKLGFKEVDGYPIYDFNKHFDAVKIAKDGQLGGNQYHYDAFVDEDFRKLTEEYISDVQESGRVRTAALRSEKNRAVDIVNVWETVLGKRDRKYAGVNLAKNIGVPNLLISIDTVTKFTGMTRLDEGQLSQLKELTYSRQNFRARKYGLKFVIHEEARLVNVHNLLQDSIQVASNKIEQKQSFDVIAEADSLTNQAGNAWDTFVASTDRSTNNPFNDIGKAQLNIEGTGIGGSLTRIGMHQLTFSTYLTNTFVRGVASNGPADYSFEVGTRDLPGIPGIGLVLDNSIRQGDVLCVDTEREPTIALFQGPQRIGSAHDEETGDDKHFIIDYHLAAVIQSETGRQIQSVMTPIQW